MRDLYKRLRNDGFEPWLDEEDLLGGQKWQQEIPKAVRRADVVLVCLSAQSVTKQGYVQKEIKFALDAADEKPEGTIYLIPVRLEDCKIPGRLGELQWVNLFGQNGYSKLVKALRSGTGISAAETNAPVDAPQPPLSFNKLEWPPSTTLVDLYRFKPSPLDSTGILKKDTEPTPPAKEDKWSSDKLIPSFEEEIKIIPRAKDKMWWLDKPILSFKKEDDLLPFKPSKWSIPGSPLLSSHELAPELNLFNLGADRLFPLYGVTLGKTTVAEIAKIASRTTTIDRDTRRPYHCYELHGVDFWYHNNDVVNHIYLTYTKPFPEKWQKLGFDWGKSYDQWITLLQGMSYAIKVTKEPRTVEYKGRPSFSAEVEALGNIKPSYKIELDFDYSQGTTTRSPGTLYSFRVLST